MAAQYSQVQISEPEETAKLLVNLLEEMDEEGVRKVLSEFLAQDGVSVYDLFRSLEAEFKSLLLRRDLF